MLVSVYYPSNYATFHEPDYQDYTIGFTFKNLYFEYAMVSDLFYFLQKCFPLFLYSPPNTITLVKGHQVPVKPRTGDLY